MQDIIILYPPRLGELKLLINNTGEKSFLYSPFKDSTGKDYYIYKKNNILYRKGCNILENSNVEHYPSEEIILTSEFQELRKPYFGTYKIINMDTIPTLTYTPNITYKGYDDIIYIYNSTIKQSTFNVLRISPKTKNDIIEVIKNKNITKELYGPKEIDQLKYIVVNNPTKGEIELNETSGEYIYTPKPNITGDDKFTYKIVYFDLESNISTISINIKNIPPVSENIEISVDEDNEVEFDLVCYDENEDELTFNIDTQPTNGTLIQLSGKRFKYKPNNLYYGEDKFTYYVNDGDDNSNISTVNININHINHTPISESIDFETKGNTPLIGNLLATDSDRDDTISYYIDKMPEKGTLELDENSGEFKYIPEENNLYDDSFTFYTKDNSGTENDTSNISKINIKVFTPEIEHIDTEDLPSISRIVKFKENYNDPDNILKDINLNIKTEGVNEEYEIIKENNNIFSIKILKEEYTKEIVNIEVLYEDIFDRKIHIPYSLEYTSKKRKDNLIGKDGDPRFHIQWDTKGVDIDINVTNPNNKIIYHAKKKDSFGGELDIDDQGEGSLQENVAWEDTFFKRAPKGEYKVYFEHFKGDKPTNVEFTAIVNGKIETKNITLNPGEKSETFTYIKE
jgi:hypothetical protein